ncbi:MAG: hypothetical protein FGM14_16850 [Flavobacteriales bacterium]|nr:hypothetical protein [Flavobacteriales bacterium]
MIVSEIKLYELLKAKLGEKEAEAFVEILETKVDHKFNEAKQTLATKEDLANTKVDLIKWMVGFWIAQMAAIIGLYMNK